MSDRATLPRWIDIGLLPAINLVFAIGISAAVVLIIGENPMEVARIMINGALGYQEGIGYTFYYATNFIFTGLAVAVAFHAGLFNIGGEGQAYLGGLGAALVCLNFPNLHWAIIIPMAIIACAFFGALWAFIPAYLRAKRGSHEVITTIMFNLIAASLMSWLLINVLSPAGTNQPLTDRFTPNTNIPKMHDFLGGLGIEFDSSPLNITFFLALICAFLVWVLIWRTRFGYAVRTQGHSPSAATYAGISSSKVIIIIMIISGALAGMMAVNESVAVAERLVIEFAGGFGFVGIAVALMGRNHPVGIVLAGILFGILYQGGADLAFEISTISKEMIVLIQGLIILFMGALEYMFRPVLINVYRALSSSDETVTIAEAK
ncbi:MAG: ABC transporter permease [Rhizobiales bacterium]|nr:ABC transporter permease [Hyphomicrobiales bacterium]NRB15345.1 ABC transporter permease [Hyphomicrobiales bacterium]